VPETQNTTEEQSPKLVNDEFWLKWAYDLINTSPGNIDKQIARINTYIAALYTLYTGSSIVAATTKGITDWWSVLLLALPYVPLLFGQFLGNAEVFTIGSNLDPRVPDTIVPAYVDIFNQKLKSLKSIKVTAFLGVTFMTIAFIYTFALKNKALNTSAPKENGFALAVAKEDAKTQQLEVTGYFRSKSQLKFYVSGNYKRVGKPDTTVRQPPSFRLNTPSGEFMTSFQVSLITSFPGKTKTTPPVSATATKYSLKVEWTDTLTNIHSLEKTISPPTSVSQ
jgi:hypothetical protein